MKSQGLLVTFFFSTLLLASCASNQEPADKTVEQKKAELYYGEGTRDLIKKDYSAALLNLTKAKEYDSKDSQIRNNLGMAYYFREQPELAIKELKEAIDLDKKNSDAKVNLGAIYLEKNRLKEARQMFEEVTSDLTYNAQFRNYYNLAMVSLKEGDRASAFDYLARSVKERADYCQAHFKLGELYTEEYKFKQALESFKEASKGTCVNEPAPHYQQALTLINLNRTDEARTKFKEIVTKFPNSRFHSLANQQLKKLSNQMTTEQAVNRQTEIIKESKTIESPNF